LPIYIKILSKLFIIWYNIYELLGEADQLGDKTEEDQEEFDRFVSSLNVILRYTAPHLGNN